ncbi:MAG: nucleotidyltransferase family protein [Clostridia bacterium]|nr:nucleotidyltransferase family protein [Clostridia bacterium]
MRIAAVICEFNPFHNGHKYLLDEIRKQGYECIICVMSGSFTQRGEVAITDKFERTRVALKNGADLIIELPTAYAVASAQIFAKGGASIIKATGVVDKVFFGSESGDIELIRKAAYATNNNKVIDLLKDNMAKGDYYPQALEKAVKEVFCNNISDILASPNNILGVEYIKELEGSNIETGTIKRIAVEHDGNTVCDNFASASLIREMIFKGEDTSGFVPQGNFSNPAKTQFGERAVMYKLKSMSPEDFEKLPDVTEGLENRIYSAVRKCSSLEELLSEIKTKRYTMARLRRIITSAILGITKDLQSSPLPYLRILGMTEKGKEALSLISKNTDLPVITSVASALKNLDEKAREMLICDIKATDIRTIFEKEISDSGADFSTAMIKV